MGQVPGKSYTKQCLSWTLDSLFRAVKFAYAVLSSPLLPHFLEPLANIMALKKYDPSV